MFLLGHISFFCVHAHFFECTIFLCVHVCVCVCACVCVCVFVCVSVCVFLCIRCYIGFILTILYHCKLFLYQCFCIHAFWLFSIFLLHLLGPLFSSAGSWAAISRNCYPPFQESLPKEHLPWLLKSTAPNVLTTTTTLEKMLLRNISFAQRAQATPFKGGFFINYFAPKKPRTIERIEKQNQPIDSQLWCAYGVYFV